MSASRPSPMSVILSAALATTSGTLPAAGDGAAGFWLPGISRLKCSSSVTVRILSPGAIGVSCRHGMTSASALSGGVNEATRACRGLRRARGDSHCCRRAGAGAVSDASGSSDRPGDGRRPGRHRGAHDRAGAGNGAWTIGRAAQSTRRQRDRRHARRRDGRAQRLHHRTRGQFDLHHHPHFRNDRAVHAR